MGAELGTLSEYKLYEPTVLQDSKHLSSLHAAADPDGKPVSVFIHDTEGGSSGRNFAENEVQLLRRLRHPHIVKYLYSAPPADYGAVQVVTEFVLSLESVEAKMHNMEVSVGLRCIVQALAFLHDKCRISHNNVCRESVMVAGSDRTWRLAGFGLASKFEATSNLYLKSIAEWRDADAIPPEDRTTSQVSRSTHARDAWGFGTLVLSFADQLSSYSELESTLPETLLHPDPECRPRMKDQLHNNLFSNQLVKVIQFVSDITLKQAKEKSSFFRSLPKRLAQIPIELVAQHLTTRLLSRFVLLEESAREHVVPCLLVPQDSEIAPASGLGLFPKALYKEHVVPILLKLFLVEDKHVRLVLLNYLEHYVTLVDRSTLQSHVLRHVLVGMYEEDDEIVAATFHSLAHLVGVLGAPVVVGCKSVSKFASSAPKPHDGAKTFRPQSLRAAAVASPTSASRAFTASSAAPTPSQSTQANAPRRHDQAGRPSCLRMEQRPNRLQGQRQSPKSPKRVTFSPKNEFPTTELDLRDSPTWQKMNSVTQGSSAGNQLANGVGSHGISQPGSDRGIRLNDAPSRHDEGGDDGFDHWQDDDDFDNDLASGSPTSSYAQSTEGPASYSARASSSTEARASASNNLAGGAGADDDDEEWEDFDATADGDGWDVENGVEDWNGADVDESQVSEKLQHRQQEVLPAGSSITATSSVTSDWTSAAQTSHTAHTGSPKQPADSSAASSPASAASKYKSNKSTEPPPAPVIAPSAEDLLLADLAPDISFFSSSSAAPGTTTTSSSAASHSKPAVQEQASRPKSPHRTRSVTDAGTSASPPRAAPISFAYQPEDSNPDEPGAEGGWDDDFEDF